MTEVKNQGFWAAEALRKKPKQAGITVRNLGTHLFLTQEMLETVRKAAKVTVSKRPRGR